MALMRKHVVCVSWILSAEPNEENWSGRSS